MIRTKQLMFTNLADSGSMYDWPEQQISPVRFPAMRETAYYRLFTGK